MIVAGIMNSSGFRRKFSAWGDKNESSNNVTCDCIRSSDFGNVAPNCYKVAANMSCVPKHKRGFNNVMQSFAPFVTNTKLMTMPCDTLSESLLRQRSVFYVILTFSTRSIR